LPTFMRVVVADTAENAVRAAWREDKVFMDLDRRYHHTKAQPVEVDRTYKLEPK